MGGRLEAGHVGEAGVVAEEGEAGGADRAVSLFGDVDFGGAAVGAVGVVELVAVEEEDDVGDSVGCADGVSDGSGRFVGSTIDDAGGGDDEGVNGGAGGSGTDSVGVGLAVGVGDGVEVGVAGGGGRSFTRLVIVKPRF